MNDSRKRLQRAVLFLVPILIGVAVFVLLVKNKSQPPTREVVDNTRQVRVFEVVATDVVPVAKGYGTVSPTNTWQAIAEVSGKAIYVNPALKKGQRITSNTLLVEIDPTEYKLAVAENRANLKSIDAQVKQIQDKETSNKELLKLELSTLKIKEKELDRQKKLLSTEIATRSDYEQAETAYIAQKYKVQAIQNTLNSLVTEYELLQAQEEQAKLNLESTLLQLEYTKIKAPFDSVVSSVNVEKSQYVQKGQAVAEADGMESVEIETQMTNGLHVFRPIVREQLPSDILRDNKSIGEALGITAVVTPTTGQFVTNWDAKVMRFNVEIDTKTRTPGVIVQVDDPFSSKSKRFKRPLIKGMYCEVKFRGRPFKNQIIIPRTALHENNIVYIVDNNNKLTFKKVAIGFAQDSFIMIRSGLELGDKVILTDVVPAVEGMSVSATVDQELTNQIMTEARGGNE